MFAVLNYTMLAGELPTAPFSSIIRVDKLEVPTHMGSGLVNQMTSCIQHEGKERPYTVNPVYNAMFFFSYSCHKKTPRIIHRCRIYYNFLAL